MDYKKIFKNREFRLKLINLTSLLPAKFYIKTIYRIKNGKKLDLKKPKTFCEKMNWLKLNEIHPEYTQLVDKIGVRNYIKEHLGEEYLFPIYGTWEHFSDINFDELPEKFVLKCNHDSGSVKVITDKSSINKSELNDFFESRLKINSYLLSREYPYRKVKPCIFAEKFMTPVGEDDINDYKFFCFDGKPVIMFIATDRSTDVKFDFFDMDFNHLDIVNIHEQSGLDIPKPAMFDEMKEIAAKLSQGMKFVRIDLYEIAGKIYFGEFTFFHGGAIWPMYPEKWEKELGDLIELN
ncbi:MAG: glycosyl transferase [Clostridia bacterium]|nr:glycosyl transferase [Clostridia bacterium]